MIAPHTTPGKLAEYEWPVTAWPLDPTLFDSMPALIKPLEEDLETVTYPWQFGTLMQRILQERITGSYVDPQAVITRPDLVNISGPVHIEAGAVIHPFVSINGPAYIARGAMIGNFTLVRSSILLADSQVGPHSEIGRSVMASRSQAFHENKILDSVIGSDTTLAGRVGTSNVRHDGGMITCMVGETAVETGLSKLGAIIGQNTHVGAAVLIMPGVLVGNAANLFMDARVLKNVRDEGKAIERKTF